MRLTKHYFYLGYIVFASFFGCGSKNQADPVKPNLKVSENHRFLESQSGEPFLWMGGTPWGMSEWLNREEVDFYLDNRKEKGFNVVQICLFWGKREEDPVRFTVNPPNAYNFRAFGETNGKADPCKPLVVEGGTPSSPNDYWDHVDYIVQAAGERSMEVALLPVWGRRYVNASMPEFSDSLFSKQDMNIYGKFLGSRYKAYSNIIWVLGGDVKADAGGDFLEHYRSMAEGILTGITGEEVPWNEESPYWDCALMTYHPDGTPLENSSEWFHHDPWLDFNMIETFANRDLVYEAVQQDYALLDPVKPTVMAEPAYEGERKPTGFSSGVQMRRQAFQSFFGGAAGFTYGAFRDSVGNGPMFSPYKGWENLLDMEGARSMIFVKSFCLQHAWPDWKPVYDIIQSLICQSILVKQIRFIPGGIILHRVIIQTKFKCLYRMRIQILLHLINGSTPSLFYREQRETITKKFKMMKQSILLLLVIFSACNCLSPESKNVESLYDYNVEEKIKELGIELSEPGKPIASYVNAVQSGNLVFMAGKGPGSSADTFIKGKIGSDLSVEQGYEAARLTAIEQLSALKAEIGDLNRVVRIVKVLGMVNADPSFTGHSQVINGFSDLMVEVFGERGKHARAAVGMGSLPLNMACEIEMIVQIKE